MQAISRKQAIEMGLKRYFTGKPCPKGHVVERMVSGRGCVDCLYASKLAWSNANPEGQALRSREWFLANKARANEQHYAWARRNRGKVAALSSAYRADRLKQMPVWADVKEIGLVYAKAQWLRELGFHADVDHVIPLRGRQVSGLHVASNLQILHTVENKRKSNRHQEL